MDVFEFVLAIVLIGVVGGIIRDRMKIKHGHTGHGQYRATGHKANGNGAGLGAGFGGCPLCSELASDGASVDEIRQKLEKLARLEERVQVLERIVTDRRVHLAEEIDRL